LSLSVFGDSSGDSLRLSELLQERVPAVTLPPIASPVFMLSHGKPVFLVSFSSPLLKATNRKARRRFD
jgi:hypothetical protein